MKYFFISTCLLLAGCSLSSTISFETEKQTESFYQNSRTEISEIDILWVIDNSGSMDTSQQSLAQNINTFLSEFLTRNLDFQMAVITTDAWEDLFIPGNKSTFRDGNPTQGPTGYPIVDKNTPDLENTFLQNLLQGTSGSGDERAFQSISTALYNPLNSGFPRDDSYVAVIILSDEDDFSHPGSNNIQGDYNHPDLIPVDAFISDYNDRLGANQSQQRYSVSSITIQDQACLDILEMGGLGGQKIGLRHMEMTNLTDGILGSLCDDFGPILAQITAEILKIVTRFYLSEIPYPETIEVKVDGALVPEDGTNGWLYNEALNAIEFYGTYIPDESSLVEVIFHEYNEN